MRVRVDGKVCPVTLRDQLVYTQESTGCDFFVVVFAKQLDLKLFITSLSVKILVLKLNLKKNMQRK